MYKGIIPRGWYKTWLIFFVLKKNKKQNKTKPQNYNIMRFFLKSSIPLWFPGVRPSVPRGRWAWSRGSCRRARRGPTLHPRCWEATGTRCFALKWSRSQDTVRVTPVSQDGSSACSFFISIYIFKFLIWLVVSSRPSRVSRLNALALALVCAHTHTHTCSFTLTSVWTPFWEHHLFPIL